MFKKPIRVKTSNRMKGSERKKLKQSILSQFPQLTEEKLNEILPNKVDAFITKIETANDSCITCYCLNKNPMFFEVDKENFLFPSVYALWQFVDTVPYMVTGPPVFEKICRGADLMLPGVIQQYGGFSSIRKGQVVAVRLAGNSAPVAVGVATMSSQEMWDCGMRGKGIQICHCYTDHLWSLGDSLEIPSYADTSLALFDMIDAPLEPESLESTMKDMDSARQESATTAEGVDTIPDVENSEENEELMDKDAEGSSQIEATKGDNVLSQGNKSLVDEEETEDTEEEFQLSAEEQMNQLLENCFYQGLIEAKKIELPILVTTFSAQFLHPACPEGKKIDIKKSKYKKMSKFLQEMEGKQLIKVAELSKGVLSITELNQQHESLRIFKASNFAKEKSAAKAEAQSKKEEEILQEGMSIIEMYGVSGKTQVFFKLFEKSKGDSFTAQEVRELLKAYVKDNELINQKDKRKVILDPLLSDILLDKNFRDESVTWDVLMSRFFEKMNPCHKSIVNGKASKVKKGKAEPIDVKVEQRMGNKKVTLVKNLEQFGIDPSDFAHRIQLAAASSTTVNPLPGKTAMGQQVLIQGNQTSHVAKVLDELKVPKKYITGLDKVKSKNKKR